MLTTSIRFNRLLFFVDDHDVLRFLDQAFHRADYEQREISKIRLLPFLPRASVSFAAAICGPLLSVMYAVPYFTSLNSIECAAYTISFLGIGCLLARALFVPTKNLVMSVNERFKIVTKHADQNMRKKGKDLLKEIEPFRKKYKTINKAFLEWGLPLLLGFNYFCSQQSSDPLHWGLFGVFSIMVVWVLVIGSPLYWFEKIRANLIQLRGGDR